MKLFLLVCFVVLVAGVVCCGLVNMANIQPIERRPEGLPPNLPASQTNAVYSTETNGTVLSVTTNAIWFIEGDIDRSPDLHTWEQFTHFEWMLDEYDGASASLWWQDGPVLGCVSARITSDPTDYPSPSLTLHPAPTFEPNSPSAMFYTLANFNAWRYEYYTAWVSIGSPY